MNKEIKRFLHILSKDNHSQEQSHEEAKKILSANGINFEEKESGDIQNEARSMDYLYGEAKELVNKEGKASPALFQRKLKVGYTRAANLIDLLEENGILGPSDGAKPRKVIIRN
ncbi:MAG: DNA translocase FtsK [Anaerolineaceae bacterium]